MPSQTWAIYDTTKDVWVTVYSTDINSVIWGDAASAVNYATKPDAVSAINAWVGGDERGTFIGKNPPPH